MCARKKDAVFYDWLTGVHGKKNQAAHLVVLPCIATGAHLALPREQIIKMHLVFSRTHIALSNSTRLAFARNQEQF